MKETSISLFKGYSDTHPQDSTLQEIVNLIRNDALVRDRTEKHRYYSHNGQKAAAAWEKAACPCFAVAVCFGGGKQAENITGWTSLALADIDHIDADRLPELIGCVRADKHTLLLFVRFLPAPGAVPDTAHDKVRFLNHHEALAVRQAENRDVADMELRI